MLKKIIKFLYNLIPFRKYLFILIRKLHVPSQNLYQHLTFKVTFEVFSGNKKFKIYHTGTIIENQLFWRGLEGFEPNSLKIWAKLCKTSDLILDLGANSGIYSLLAKSENPSSTVHAFEPVERIHKILENNASINDFDITCHNKAISNSDGIGFFFDDEEEITTSINVNTTLAEAAIYKGVSEETLHFVEIETITLDTFIKENKISKIDLMKIDVELHEPEVFEGFKENLEKFKPTLVIEIVRDYIASSIEEKLSGLGYNYFYINEPYGGIDHPIEGSSYQKVDSLKEGRYGNYLICRNDIADELSLL